MVRKLRRRVPVALGDGEAKAVHEARVSTRRLRASLDLLAPVVPAKMTAPLRKTARRLRRRLGTMRDLDVMVDVLERLQRRPRYAAAARWMIQQLRDERAKARRKAQKKRPAEQLLDRLAAWATLRDQVLQLGGVIDGLMITSLRSQWDAFAAKADARTSNLFDEVCGEDIANPHELRIAGKMLRYTFEMLAEAGHPLPQVVRPTFKRMQDALGDWHDCVVLAEHTLRLSLDQSLALCDPATERKVLELARFVLRRGDRALRGFAALWEGNGRAVAAAVSEIISRLQTDRDRVGSDRPAIAGGARPNAPSAA